MKIKSLFLITMLSGLLSSAYAQYVRFPFNGVIEYDKTTNMYAMVKKLITGSNSSFYQQAFDSYKKNQPQFKVSKSTLSFNKDKSLFSPVEETTTSGSFFDLAQAKQINTIYTDFATQTSTTQKNVYEELFLVKDSVRKINWKITTETREIAGYQCRRANALIMDSIYVVAFYTDQIPVSGGPESFGGLPGMILGVALPHENVTWFATKVTDRAVTPKELYIPVKGKPTDNKGLMQSLNRAFKEWGSQAQSNLKAFTL
ncbi:GLPGLI family protein [Pedobacter duraquae]|uniref:GLPGLI family protein n=1 Tax=Pedobacter duraquae TaxID=425511 RepID=A0A4R6IKH5_9SPHI|nr:GLPGLI family protein [Pedobacter duraquae]TDO22562.1 GLPGLI family protein [Pedobacter duraquae]